MGRPRPLNKRKLTMKLIYSILILLMALLPAACTDASEPDLPQPVPAEGTPVDLVTGAMFPEMKFGRSSRAMNDEPTVDELLNSLKVNLFVFDQSGVMLQFIGHDDISIVNIDTESKHVYFKVHNIYSSSRPRRLHFVITSADDLHAVDGGEYITAMASETTTMPALVVADGTDAYWGVREVESITENMTLDIKLIRNFVKLNVRSTADGGVFRLLGYTVVNRPSRGTIAPYIYRDHLFASFLNPDNSLIDYEDIIAQGYFGVNPSGSDLSMTHTTESEVQAELAASEAQLAAGAEDTPCYIYERSQSSVTSAGNGVMVTYIILSGEYKGKKCYYKIDIGHDKEGKFGFYDLLRNFQYTVEITEVGGEGAPTLRDAMNGAAHNNLSASVVTRDLFSIGYEGEQIEVSSTRVIFTEKGVNYALRFRYTTPAGIPFDPTKLKIYDITEEAVEYDMGGVSAGSEKSIGLKGEVIESASLTKDADGWYVLHISTGDIPSDSRRMEQNIRVYYTGSPAGLGRTVTLMLRRPWEFGNVSASSPASGIGSGMTLDFSIPSGLSQSQFPLTITFESDKQNIYGLNGSQLSVATGRSSFAGATTDDVILYEWRIEWADYHHDNGSDGGQYTASFRMNTTSADDLAFSTAGIDAAAIAGRTANNGTRNFCIRIANKGQKYIQPQYVNITRR